MRRKERENGSRNRRYEGKRKVDARTDRRTARWTDRSEREQERIVEWNDWKSEGSLIGLRADGSVVATHARLVYAACQGLRGVEGGWGIGRRARGWRGDG